MKSNRFGVLSRNAVKYIACLTMLIDHMGCVFFAEGSTAYMVCRLVLGRIAYPLFCVLFVDGLYRTRRPWRHMLDLAAFALLTEAFFDRALFGSWWFSGAQNVLWSWLLGGTVLFLFRTMADWADRRMIEPWQATVMDIAIFAGAMALSVYLSLDYSAVGILCVVAVAWTRRFPLALQTFVVAALETILFATPGALLAVPVMLLHDPDRACRRSRALKYGFYGFYPAHLAVLSLIRILSGI